MDDIFIHMFELRLEGEVRRSTIAIADSLLLHRFWVTKGRSPTGNLE